MALAPRTRATAVRTWVLITSVAIVTGCGSTGPQPDGASGVAGNFHRAVRQHEWAAACSLLAPSTVQGLEQEAKSPCAHSLAQQDIVDSADVLAVQVWGLAAQVRMDRDVLFLTTVDGRWRITAAGCVAQGDAPYRCSVKGG